MTKGNVIIERTNPYKNTRHYWNGVTWVETQYSALSYTDDEARKLLRKFNKQDNYQFIFRMEKVN